MLALKVPLLTALPLIVSVYEPPIVKVAPELMVILLQRPPAAPILGELGVPEEIVTFVEASGIALQLQFDAVFQSELVVPSHVPVIHVFTYNKPVALVPK